MFKSVILLKNLLNILNIMKRPRIIRSQSKEPITIPEKLPEFEPFHDPVAPQIYPDENPVESPQ